MFLEIKKHDGVYLENDCNSCWSPLLINLSLVYQIKFDTNSIELTHSAGEFICRYNLKFTKEGMGEYHRIKRIIESQTLS